MNSHERRDTTEPAEPTVLDSRDHGWLIVDSNAPGGVRELTAAEDAALAEQIRAGALPRDSDTDDRDVADSDDQLRARLTDEAPDSDAADSARHEPGRLGGRHWTYGPGAPPGADRPGRWPERDDSDGWYSSGADDAHQADLDARAHVDDVTDVDALRLNGENGDSRETEELVDRAHWAVTRCGPVQDPAITGRRGEAARRDELADHLADTRSDPAALAYWVDEPAERGDTR